MSDSKSMTDKVEDLDAQAVGHKKAIKFHRKSLRECREEQRRLREECARMGIGFEIVKQNNAGG